MKLAAIAAALSLAALTYAFPAGADDDRGLRFRGGIGVHPVSNVSGVANADGSFPNVTRNIVRGVNPAGQIWVIDDLKAEIDLDSGNIRVDGRGLLLAGGNGIGGNAGASVFATLICEAAAPFTERSTAAAGVALEANGDFRIDDVLDPRPAGVCASPVLLVRNANGRAWFAAGILKRR